MDAAVLPAVLEAEAHGRSFLLVQGEDALPTLRDRLAEAGATVTVATAYSNRIPEESRAAIATLFANPSAYPHAAAFTSASTVHNLVAMLKAAGLSLPESVTRASIGPVTSRALTQHGLPPHIEAAQSTVAGLVECLGAHFRLAAGPKLY